MGRVLRGGCWNNDNRRNFRVSYRNENDPDDRNDNIGFRVVAAPVSRPAADRNAGAAQPSRRSVSRRVQVVPGEPWWFTTRPPVPVGQQAGRPGGHPFVY